MFNLICYNTYYPHWGFVKLAYKHHGDLECNLQDVGVQPHLFTPINEVQRFVFDFLESKLTQTVVGIDHTYHDSTDALPRLQALQAGGGSDPQTPLSSDALISIYI